MREPRSAGYAGEGQGLRLLHVFVKNMCAIGGNNPTIRRKAEHVLLSSVNTLAGRTGYGAWAGRVGQRHHRHHAI